MRIYFNDQYRKQIGNAFIFILIVCFVAAIWGTFIRVREGIEETKNELQKNGQLMVEDLDHELDIHIYNLIAMKYVSERFFSERTQGVENPVTRLQAIKDQTAYESVLPEGFTAFDAVGRITGFGKLPALTDAVAKEMEMAVGLTPVMRAIRERSPDVPWVQYASARGFMFIFPSKGADHFFFTPELMKREYFARATPQMNPQRAVFWSKPYADAAGKGSIVTVTQPIYENDDFRGSVSIDVLVSSLQRQLFHSTFAQAHVHLVDQAGAIIASSSTELDDSAQNPHKVVKIRLKSAPWFVELHMNQTDLVMHSLRGRSWHIVTLLVLAICLVSVILLTRKSRQIHELSIRDGLTGLYNRRYFDQVAQQQFELAKRHHLSLALAIMDIDFFKKFNDHYGHQQGDHALREVAKAAQKALRRGSDQLFRVGGEEFAVLLSIDNVAELAPQMEKINQAVRDLRMPHVGNPSGYMSISIGATLVSADHWMDVDAAYKRADDCLYEAKSTGRDRAVVSLD